MSPLEKAVRAAIEPHVDNTGFTCNMIGSLSKHDCCDVCNNAGELIDMIQYHRTGDWIVPVWRIYV